MKKTIGEIPDKRAESIGLRHCSNGYVDWLEDGDGNEYRPPQWLLDLLHIEKGLGYAQAQANIRAVLGLNP